MTEERRERIRENNRRYYWKNVEKERVRSRGKSTRYRQKDPEKLREYVRSWRRKNPDKVLNWTLRREYGITLEEFRAMLAAQNGRCAICLRTAEEAGWAGPRKSTPRLCVDHDHVTGKVRALLCDPCNRGLGDFGDDLERLACAIAYKKRFS